MFAIWGRIMAPQHIGWCPLPPSLLPTAWPRSSSKRAALEIRRKIKTAREAHIKRDNEKDLATASSWTSDYIIVQRIRRDERVARVMWCAIRPAPLWGCASGAQHASQHSLSIDLNQVHLLRTARGSTLCRTTQLPPQHWPPWSPPLSKLLLDMRACRSGVPFLEFLDRTTQAFLHCCPAAKRHAECVYIHLLNPAINRFRLAVGLRWALALVLGRCNASAGRHRAELRMNEAVSRASTSSISNLLTTDRLARSVVWSLRDVWRLGYGHLGIYAHSDWLCKRRTNLEAALRLSCFSLI